MNDSARPHVALRSYRRWLRIVGSVLIVAAGVLAGVWVRRFHRREPRSAPLPPLPANVNQQLSGYTFTRSEGGKRIFSIYASRTVAFGKAEVTMLEDVTAELFDKTGNRCDVLRADKCLYYPSSGAFACPGTVTIELDASPDGPLAAAGQGSGVAQSGPLRLRTSKLAFDPSKSQVATPETVQLTFGPAQAAAVGVVYATRDGWLELKNNVSLEWPLGTASGSSEVASRNKSAASGPVRLPPSGVGDRLVVKASRLRYEQSSGQVHLTGPLEVTEATRHLTAAAGTVFLDRQRRVVSAALEGGVRARDTSPVNPLEAAADCALGTFDPASEQLKTLTLKGNVMGESRRRSAGVNDRDQAAIRLAAGQVEVDFIADSRSNVPASGGSSFRPVVPQKARARGDVHMALESIAMTSAGMRPQPDRVRRELMAPEVLLIFRSQPVSLWRVSTNGTGSLVLASGEAGKRTITADHLSITFDRHSRPESLQGSGRCHLVFDPPPGPFKALPQETFSEELEARIDSSTQQLVEAKQNRGFEFHQGDRRAKADRAYYSAPDQELTLAGSPLLWDSESRLRAEQVMLHVGTGLAEGLGKVESTYAPPRARGPAQPVDTLNIIADRVAADRGRQLAHYEGHVRAWRGFDVLESPWLDLYRGQRRLVAGGGVVASLLQPSTAVSGNGTTVPSGRRLRPPGAPPVVIRGEHLIYLDDQRQAQFDGHVRADAGDMTLTADGLVAYFSAPAAGPSASMKDGDATPLIERLVARGHVVATDSLRRATADQAEYWSAEGKVVLSGGPPVLYDAEKGFTTGHCLTFLTRDDSLLVDGGDQSPAVSKRRIAR